MTKSTTSLLKWVAGPIVVAAFAGWVGQAVGNAKLARAFGNAAALPQAERAALETAPRRAAGNAAWALGSVESVKLTAKGELDHLSESEGQRRAQILTRFGVVDTNPDGQAAVFGQVCVADPPNCEHRKETARRETEARLVSPGNHLPLFFLDGHPHVPM